MPNQEKDSKTLIFSVTKEDCDWQTFTSGGKGGQHQNRVQTGVRCRHRASGAVGTSRDTRSQITNKRAAFKRMAETAKFRVWIKVEIAKRNGQLADIEAAVDASMDESNLKVEFL